MDQMRTYKILPADEIVRLFPSGEFAAASERWCTDQTVEIPAISYGQVQEPEFDFWQWPPNNWREPSYRLQDIKLYRFKNAVVHGELGVITVGDYCVAESLHMVFPQMHGFTKPSETEIGLPEMAVDRIDSAFHALCGYVGNRNYAHWWIDVLPPVGYQLLERRFGDAVPLLPQIRAGYQTQCLDLISEVRDRAVFVQQDQCLHVSELQFVPSLTAGDYLPQPGNMDFVNEIKSRAGAKGVAMPEARSWPWSLFGKKSTSGAERRNMRRIYLSRKDAPARRMLNEDAICDIASRHGFEVLTTTGMPLVEQIKLFSEASHVISPHGAGLANTMFCPPGGSMLELHYDNSVNWSLRRLASIVPLRYGCIVGRQEPQGAEQSEEQAKQNPWTLPEDVFERVISSAPFV
ncbi:glycosyltransferase family 61 protein [Roseibium litorale]|uniref:Glycosyltransferase family 61 protein n=1 Tax=Roseibium litorale TaxID=2803841 RepID=A0ABR9CTR7_9HYPH|nr:glycosyltransferase family 61 protein [Roseibium litorale]MBD8894271.1 glycosyltransferase family 61 protein [Roseibium litorale]